MEQGAPDRPIPMIIHDIQKSREREGVQTLSATVTYETPQPRSFHVYFTLEGAAGDLTDSADPFVIGFLLAAMLLGEDMDIRGEVDPELLKTIEEKIMPLVSRWFPFLPRIELKCETPRPPAPRDTPGLNVLAFSGGLDACYSAVKHHDSTDALLVSWGFDVRSHQELLWKRTLPEIRAVADLLGKPLLVIRTNLQEVSHYQAIRTRRGHIDPRFYQLGRTGANGPYLAAIGRCLEPFCPRYMFAASDSKETIAPFGSHPDLDPLWSTPNQQVIYDGFEAGRIEKVRFLRDHHPELLGALHVCWHPERVLANCSRCEKCLRTMAEVRLVGAEDLATGFRWPIDLKAVEEVEITRESARAWWRLIAERARRVEDVELAAAVRKALGPPVDINRLWQRLSGRGGKRHQAREHWKYVRRILKPPPEASGEIPTPAEVLGRIPKTRIEAGTQGSAGKTGINGR